MLCRSSVAMRLMGVASPAVCPNDPPVLQLLFGVSSAVSTFGGDCRTGFSVLRNAAGT